MATRRKKRITDKDLEAGTLVRIPLRRRRVAIGQIVRPGIQFYMCVFLPVLPPSKSNLSTLDNIDDMTPVLCFLTTDAPFYHERWSICGKARIHPDIPYPRHKINVYGKGMVIKDVDENIVRVASKKDEKTFPYRRNVGEENVTDAIELILSTGSLPPDDQQMLVSFIRKHQ